MENIETKEIALTEEQATKMTDESVRAMIDQLGENDEIPEEIRSLMKSDFTQYIKNDEDLMGELSKLQAEYKALIDQSNSEFKKLTEEMNLEGIIIKLGEIRDTAKKIGNERAVAHYEKLINELGSSITLHLMFENLKNVKNPSKLVTNAASQFGKEFKKFRQNLNSNQRYYFADPVDLPEAIRKHMPETQPDYAEIFLFSLCRLINGKGQENVVKYSVFLGQLIKNIYALDDERFEGRQILIDSIVDYCDRLAQ